MEEITLGSLFDGSGGFPLAGVMNGITPLWASEIEPYPIKVTTARFPHMKHLGSVLDVNGAEIEPVDVITFGSPCQDLSIAGKQKGIHEGERSNLFFEAVRIIKEMRAHDRADSGSNDHIRPRFAVWENVPGAFSSNKGADFRAVLQALAEIKAPGVSVPDPPGKWRPAGCIVGDGWSIAWRVFDAQFWGVPQRRKRIYLVADFASERAGEILFEREGLHGYPAAGGDAWKVPAAHAPGSAGGGGVACFKERAGKPGGGKGILINKDSHAFTLSTLVDQSIAYPVAFRKATKPHSAREAPRFEQDEIANCLNAFDIGETRASEYIVQPVYSMKSIARNGNALTELANPICASDYKDPDIVATPASVLPHKYIVRRLTPLECCRLQGFPDWWEVGVEGSDRARYKMWGNGIALPCAANVLWRVSKAMREA